MAESEPRKRGAVEWIKDALIPIAGLLLAVLGFLANADANRRQRAEAQAAREQKYLEYFLQNYSDTSSTRQSAAFALLKYMNPQVRQDLVYGLSANTELSREAWQVIATMPGVQLNFGEANRYRVDVFYAMENADAAGRIAQQLQQAGFGGTVTQAGKVPAFWDTYGWPKGNEVRFEPVADARAMQYLFRFLEARNPELRLKAEAVQDPSRPESVSIHLPPKRP
jgi:hypothetical protein